MTELKDILVSYKANDEVVANTPTRVVKALDEMLQYQRSTNEDIAKLFGKSFETSNTDLVVVDGIKVWTLCEHHLLPFSLTVAIGVIPDGFALGLSKYSRIAQAVGKRLMMQERYVEDLANVLRIALVSEDIAVVAYDSMHTCACARGAEERAMNVTTSHLSGGFRQTDLRREFMSLIGATK